MYNVFFNKINASMIKIARDQANTRGINRVVGNLGDWVLNDPSDFKNAKTLFVWGANITDAQIHDWHFVADAQDAGTKLVVIDPIMTQLAARAGYVGSGEARHRCRPCAFHDVCHGGRKTP